MRRTTTTGVLLVALALALTGCGGGGAGGGGTPVDVPSGSTATREPVPLVGVYRGSLYDYGQTTWITFGLDSNGVATGEVSFNGSTTSIQLTGSVAESTLELTLTGTGLTITGQFYGAYSKTSGHDYTTDGVHFKGTWTKPDQSHGKVDAWHESWPPYHHSPTWYESYSDYYLVEPAVGVVLSASSAYSGYTVYDDETDNSGGTDSSGDWSSGGSSSDGGSSSGGSSGGSSSDSGSSSGGSSGGDSTDYSDYTDVSLDDWTWTQEPYGSIDPPAVDGYDDWSYRGRKVRHLRHVFSRPSRSTVRR